MDKLILCLCLVLSVGCASSKLQYEPTDRYSSIESPASVKVEVPSLPPSPVLSVQSVKGEEVAVLSLEGVNQLLAFRQQAQANTASLVLAAELYNQAIERDRLLVQALKLEEERSNHMHKLHVHAENTRQEESKSHTVDSIIYRAIILVLGAALAF